MLPRAREIDGLRLVRIEAGDPLRVEHMRERPWKRLGELGIARRTRGQRFGVDELGLALAPPASSSVVALLEREEHRTKILDRLHRGLCGARLGLEQVPEAARPLRRMNATVDHAR